MTVAGDPEGAAFILDFASTQAGAKTRITAFAPQIGEKTVTRVAYPKGSKAAGYDVNRDTLAAFARTVGLVAVANVAIDEIWSALRLRPDDGR